MTKAYYQYCESPRRRHTDIGRGIDVQIGISLTHMWTAVFLFFFLSSSQLATAVDFDKEIQPILAAHCYECHGEEAQESGLRLDVGDSLLEGGYSGPSIVSGKSEKSLLIRAVQGGDDDISPMPPEGPPLHADKIALLRRWIDDGAEMPKSSGAVTKKKKSTHWSYQPIAFPVPPQIKSSASIRNPIDRFIVAKLEEEGLSPSIEADKSTLIRRLSLDLLGLPPTIEEVDAFVADTSDSAYDRLVNRLLDSPHYGERWGRHWLDVARFAESNGYTIDSARSIWKYRDWVIEAINNDMPYDQFVIEQIAGDMLPKATTSQIIATGFHRNTMVNEEGGTDDEQFRVEAVVDRVATTGAAFLGLTLGCARCHDHKYDPISQREFYELFAIFNNSDEPTLPLPTAEQSAKLAAKRQEIAKLEASPQADTRPQPWLDEIAKLKQQKKQIEQSFTTTLVMKERSEPRVTNIHLRGDFLRLGARVSPGVPSVLLEMQSQEEVPDRLDLAHWLVDPNNTLTARVTVNRVWQHYFGSGLVATENDFGTQGDRPTHPQLLDWLASQFMKNDWSLKQLHHLIVTSATYRQSSRMRNDLLQVDPYNKLLGRQQRLRLEAESIRDVSLAASGLLSTEIGGPSVYPPQPEGIYRFTQKKQHWGKSEGSARYRRGMYTYLWRSSPYPFLKTFDAPDATVTCTRRSRSNTPLQALTLANDVAFFEIAQGFAADLLKQQMEDESRRIRFAFRRCLSRHPQDSEMTQLTNYLDQQRQQYQQLEEAAVKIAPAELPEGTDIANAAAWTMLARVLLNLDEFITRE